MTECIVAHALTAGRAGLDVLVREVLQHASAKYSVSESGVTFPHLRERALHPVAQNHGPRRGHACTKGLTIRADLLGQFGEFTLQEFLAIQDGPNALALAHLLLEQGSLTANVGEIVLEALQVVG